MLNLKGKLKRVDSGMSKDDFAVFCAENIRHKYERSAKKGGMFFEDGDLKPLYLWEHFLWRDVVAFKSQAYVVRPEYKEEVIGTLLMAGTLYPVWAVTASSFGAVMEALGLTPRQVIVHQLNPDPDVVAVAWGNVVPHGTITIMALQTDKCWLVYPNNLRHVNWQLRRQHG